MRLIGNFETALTGLGWRLLATLRPTSNRGPVFVVGTGRSGTHFLTRTLVTHPGLDDLVSGRENPFVFKRVESLAQSEEKSPAQLLEVLKRYKVLSGAAQPRILVDQSHTNLWLVPQLLAEFPGARFLALIRDPVSVAFSTGLHPGVRNWLEQPYPVPVHSLFIGNRDNLFADYDKLSLYQKSAIRWASHVLQTYELILQVSEERIMPICYEDLCRSPGPTLQRISAFLAIENEFEMPEVNEQALSKKNLVPHEDVIAIREVLLQYFAAYPIGGEVKTLVGRYLELPG